MKSNVIFDNLPTDHTTSGLNVYLLFHKKKNESNFTTSNALQYLHKKHSYIMSSCKEKAFTLFTYVYIAIDK